MNAYFFGDSEKPLFGILHPPRGLASEPRAVVLCPPMGQEYMRSHRAYRSLAGRLARKGFHVFRFDYFGTGDSAGESDEGSPRIWLENIATAIEELRESAALERVTLVGLRLGGALAAVAATGRSDIDELVLWDSVVDGNDFVRELDEVASPPQACSSPGTVGVLGFPFTDVMRREIQQIDLRKSLGASIPLVSILVSSEQQAAKQLEKALGANGADVRYQVIPSAGNWNEVDNFGGALVPQEIIQGVVTTLASGSGVDR
jgi:pimeloyl-ACP methyl ester carboxylesterase